MSKNDIWDEVKNLTAPEKVSKAKITLNKEQPFFAYLVEHLNIKEDTQGRLPFPTMGVDAKGNCIYHKDFVTKVTKEQLVGTLAHEVLHVANEHILRERGRSITVNGLSVWNIAIDIVTNHMLVLNNFELPENGIIPRDGQVTIFNKYSIDNIEEKSAEDIYEELKVILKKMIKNGEATEGSGGGQGKGKKSKGQGSGKEYKTKDGDGPPSGFDNHLKGKGDKDKPGSGKSGKPDANPNIGDKDWKKIMAEAVNHSKMRGNTPLGAGRMFEELHRHKINWNAYLRRVIASKIPFDITYSRPNKKFLNQDIFMPSVVGESVKVICAIDTSGSMSQQDLEDALSEMIGISKSFHHVDFFVVTHDHAVHDYIKIFNGNIQKIKDLKIHGGGGTSHIPLYEFIREKRLHRETKLLVSFTDGYSEFPERCPEVETIFVLGGGHIPADQMPSWGTTICLD